jgi:hypothetical protein
VARSSRDYPPLPFVVIVPGAVLGAFAEVPAYLIADRLLLDQLLTYLTAAFAYYLFLVYAEGLGGLHLGTLGS